MEEDKQTQQNIEIIKGFRDIMPAEALKREKIKEIVSRYYKLYGFLPIETPIIESRYLAKGENESDEAISDMFKLEDKGQRPLALRYEFTFQLGRIFKENKNIKLPFKRYQIGEIFRDEPISAKRVRQFTQCDIDIIGDSSAKADAECLAVVSDIFKELKIKSKILINNRKIINTVLEKLGITEKQAVMREVDKLNKLSEDEIKQNLKKYMEVRTVVDLFAMLSKPIDYFVKEKFTGAEEIQQLMNECRKYGIKPVFKANLIRGLSYYTGNIFEIVEEKDEKLAICGGGRYDNSVGKYINRQIPAVGISFSLERISDLAKIPIDTIKCIVISIGKDAKAFALAKKLREAGIPTATSDKIGKGLEYANSYAIGYAIFIGADEVKSKKFKLRDMKTGKESSLGEESLIRFFKKIN